VEQKQKYRFSLAIPFYNEELNIISVVSTLSNDLESVGLDFQLVLINNG